MLSGVVVLVAAVVAVSCTSDPGGGGGGPTPGRFNAIPRDAGPCGPDQPIAPKGYFARANVSALPATPQSQQVISTLATWNGSNNGNLNVFWGNASLVASQWDFFNYPVNFVNTLQTGSPWATEHWNVGAFDPIFHLPVGQRPFFIVSPALTSPQMDAGPYPAMRRGAENAWHQGSPDVMSGDRYAFFHDSGTCKTYELGVMHLNTPDDPTPLIEHATGDSWWAQTGAIWDQDLTPTSQLRATYWEPTGVGAAAIPITPMVLRFDEVARNVAADPVDPAPLDHALYWASATPTSGPSCGAYVWPARHADCGNHAAADPTKPAQGDWLRLKATFDDSGYSPQMKVVIRTLKTRGMVFADGSSSVNGIAAEPAGCQAVGGSTVALTDASRCWTSDSLTQLGSNPIGLDQFEVVDPTAMRLDPTLVGGLAGSADNPNLWKCTPTFDCG